MIIRHPGHRPRSLSPLVEFRNVTVVRGGRRVLDDLSVTIGDGENVAILGPNGAGKSSFIKTITRECYPVMQPRGAVFRIKGRDAWNVFDLRSMLGIVTNDLQQAFPGHTTGLEVILSGFFSSIGLFNHVVTSAMEQKADDVARLLGIERLQDRPLAAMSTGEARRHLIGRALVNDPRALILDEPTGSLDLHALHTFRTTLRSVAHEGTAVIMVTQNLHDIIPETTRVILMKDGRFVLDGPKGDVLTDERIGGLFEVPVRVREEDGWYYATGY